MGITSSRAVLLKPPEPRKSELYPKPNLAAISEADRLVRDELRKEAQRSIRDQVAETRNRLSFLQVSSEGLQQEDVRPLLSMEKNSIPRPGHNSRPAELL